MSNSWDIRFLHLAKHISEWSKDPSTKAGSVIIRPDRTISSMGYNGFPRGMIDMKKRLEDREDKYDRTVHAEMNAILSSHERLSGHTIYVWPFFPCHRCAVHIVQAGIARVVSPKCPIDKTDRWEGHFAKSREYFRECGVKYEEIDLHLL